MRCELSPQPSDVAEATVLIVDDDDDICRALSDLLEHEGYRIHAVGTGTEAITRAKATRFTAVILDLGLPDMDGAQVLRTLTDFDHNLPVIILSAFTAEEKTMGLLRQGAYAYLTKPYNKDQIKATLARAVGVKALAMKAEQIARALNDTEQRLHSVMESANDAIILANHRGLIMSWNQAARQLFGYTEDDVIGRPFTLLLPARYQREYQDDLDTLTGAMNRRLVGRTVELHGLRKDGTEFPAEFCLGLWTSSEGRFYSGFIRDITERKKAEFRLQESEERLRLALMAANMGIWDWEMANDRVMWSEHVCRLFGLPHDTIERTRNEFLTLVHPDDRGSVATAIARAIETGTEYDIEHRIVWPNGEVRWLGCKGRALCDRESRALRLLGTVQDITERKRAEEQLLRQQMEQQALLDLIPAMVWYKDRDNRIIRANRLAAESINRSPAEVEGQSTYDLYPEEAEKYYQDDLAVIHSGRPKLDIVEMYQMASGEKRWVRTDKVPYRDAQGTIVGVLVFAQDITERKRMEEALQRSEQRLQSILDFCPAVIQLKDLQGRYLFVNRRWEVLFHRTREDVSGVSLYDVFPKEIADALRANDRRVFEMQGALEIEEVVPLDDGEHIFRSLKFPLVDASGKPYAVCGIATDITERKQSPKPGSHHHAA